MLNVFILPYCMLRVKQWTLLFNDQPAVTVTALNLTECVKELSLNNLHTLPCLFFRLLRQKASAIPASPAFFSLHSKKHPAEIVQVIFGQFLRNNVK